jgi:hypothetical protein
MLHANETLFNWLNEGFGVDSTMISMVHGYAPLTRQSESFNLVILKFSL